MGFSKKYAPRILFVGSGVIMLTKCIVTVESDGIFLDICREMESH